MTTFEGTITTTGRSEAIRLDKALFRAHPEFRQKAKVRVHVLGTGRLLISLVEDGSRPEAAADPVVEAFLGFLERDLETRPERIRPLSETRVAEAEDLTAEVTVADDEELPEDVSV